MSELREVSEGRKGHRGIYTGEGYRPSVSNMGEQRSAHSDVRTRRTAENGVVEQSQNTKRNGREQSQNTKQNEKERSKNIRHDNTQQDKPGTSSLQKKLQARKSEKHKKILLGAGSVLAVAYIAVAFFFGFHFYRGTMFYGIDCSYMTAKQVKEEASDKLDEYVLEVLERDDRTETISAKQIGLTFEDSSSIDRMLKSQRAYIWPVMLFLDKTQIDSVAFSYDKKMAGETLDSLECMDSLNYIAPQDAYVSMTDTGYEVVQEVMGTTLDREKTLAAVITALDGGDSSVSLDENKCYVDPVLYSDNEELKSDAAAKSELAKAHIVYDFGDRQEVVDVSVIDDWIVELSDGSFTIDETRVTEYVENLAEKYDTFGLTRQFYTSIGTVVTLEGGDYGWCIDQDATMAALMTALAQGYQGAMEPVYLYTGMSRETNDIGYTYVEVCISQQRMWCYQNGNLIVDTPVVTGNPNRGNATPSGGVWAIDAKMRDYVLKGEGYTAPVDYWMPFNGDVGIHDMQQRAAFGGTIYLSNGSHGCVNTPYEQAQTIYNAVSIGTPVIVYE